MASNSLWTLASDFKELSSRTGVTEDLSKSLYKAGDVCILADHNQAQPVFTLTTMSKPSEGTYVIANRILSPSGQELAITFNGENHATTLTPKANSPAQRVCSLLYFIIPHLHDYFSGFSRIMMPEPCPLHPSTRLDSRQRGARVS